MSQFQFVLISDTKTSTTWLRLLNTKASKAKLMSKYDKPRHQKTKNTIVLGTKEW